MATLLTLDKCCDLALKKIGVVAIADTAATEEESKRAREQADLMLPHYLDGIMRSTPMIQQSLTFDLVGGDGEYDLADELALDAIAVVLNARVKDSSGKTYQCRIMGLDEWSKIGDVETATGTPCKLYISPEDRPTLKTYPTLGDDATGFSLELDVLAYGEDFIMTTEQRLGLPRKFQLWFVTQLAHLCAAGPVRKKSLSDQKAIWDEAETYWEALTAYGNSIRTTGDDCVDGDPYESGGDGFGQRQPDYPIDGWWYR